MATEFCQNWKQSHPGRVCDYDAQGECAETTGVEDGGAPCEHGTTKRCEESQDRVIRVTDSLCRHDLNLNTILPGTGH